MPLTPDNRDRITQIFFPYTEQKLNGVRTGNRRFVYYTTADTASNILKNKQIWLRNTSAMTDYREVEHGFDCLNAAYKEEPGKVFNASLDACFPGLAEEVKTLFNGWLPNIRRDTYIVCFSEHLEEEDQHGRLSMWRAYGGSTGIALVLNNTVMLSKSNALNIFSSPVSYWDSTRFAAEFMKIAQNMYQETEFIKSLGRETVLSLTFNMFLFAAVCTKHPGFHEEQEWRAIASPTLYPPNHVTSSIEVVRGIPQTVLKLDLFNEPEKDLVGLAIPDLINSVIIGPCEFPGITYDAFVRLLKEANVPEPEKKIIISDIPLRQA